MVLSINTRGVLGWIRWYKVYHWTQPWRGQGREWGGDWETIQTQKSVRRHKVVRLWDRSLTSLFPPPPQFPKDQVTLTTVKGSWKRTVLGKRHRKFSFFVFLAMPYRSLVSPPGTESGHPWWKRWVLIMGTPRNSQEKFSWRAVWLAGMTNGDTRDL